MRHQPIRTQWHVARESMLTNRPEDRLRPGSSYYDVDWSQLPALVSIIDAAPKYYIEDSLTELLQSPGVSKSLRALHDCGICALPAPIMFLEFNSDRGRELVLLSERTNYMIMSEGEDGPHPLRALVLTLSREDLLPGRRGLALSPIAICLRTSPLEGGGIGFHEASWPAPYVSSLPSRIEDSPALRSRIDADGFVAAQAASAAMLLLNTRGVEKTVVDPGRLNRRRTSSGRASPIPVVTTVRVGHVYDRRGDRAATAASGRTVRVHLRAGHTRSVPYGPAGARSGPDRRPAAERPHRLAYIPPCLVNYDPADGAPPPDLSRIERRVTI